MKKGLACGLIDAKNTKMENKKENKQWKIKGSKTKKKKENKKGKMAIWPTFKIFAGACGALVNQRF